jgi:hypothetical protein
MLSKLFSCGGMRHGSHHLYDELETQMNSEASREKGPPLQRQSETNNDNTTRDEDFE